MCISEENAVLKLLALNRDAPFQQIKTFKTIAIFSATAWKYWPMSKRPCTVAKGHRLGKQNNFSLLFLLTEIF